MKKWCFFTICLLYGLSGFTQDIQISKEQYLRTDHDYQIIGKVGDKVLMLKFEGEKKRLQAYNDKMRQVWEKEIKLERKMSKIIGVVSNKENFTLIYGYKRKGRFRVMARKFNNNLNV